MEEYIEVDVYLEIENVQYGRMLAELCLYEILNLKNEEDQMASLIGRYTDTFTQEEGNILRENGFAIYNSEWSDEENRMFRLIGKIIKPGDKLTERQKGILIANGYEINEEDEIVRFLREI